MNLLAPSLPATLLDRCQALISLSGEARRQAESLIDAFVACQVARCLEERDRRAWLAEELPGYGPTQSGMAWLHAERILTRATEEMLGPFALLSCEDARAVMPAFSDDGGFGISTYSDCDYFSLLADELGLIKMAPAEESLL